MALGTHHYVQISESEMLKNANPDDFDSLEWILPAGAAVPQSCQAKYKEKMKNLKLIINGYGQSEMGVITMGVTSLHLGAVMPGNRIKVRMLLTYVIIP